MDSLLDLVIFEVLFVGYICIFWFGRYCKSETERRKEIEEKKWQPGYWGSYERKSDKANEEADVGDSCCRRA